MNKTEIINLLLYEYSELKKDKIVELCKCLSNKTLRWLGINHEDNNTRKIFYELTNIDIGRSTVINQNFIVSDDYKKLLTIGERVAISPNVTIICSSSPNNSRLSNNIYVKENLIKSSPVNIKNDVWIGANSIILPGVTISENTIIGAGSVVNKSTLPNSIYAGVPAKKLKRII